MSPGRLACLAALALGGAALPVAAGAQSGGPGATTPTSPTATSTTPRPTDTGQAFFRDAIAKDPRTLADLRAGLASGALFVDPATTYGDLTGDGKADAVVRVDSGGAAGSIALYVFTVDGPKPTKKLRIVFRIQRLTRAVVALAGGGLTVVQPAYRRGDEAGRPSAVVRRTYAWVARSATLRRR